MTVRMSNKKIICEDLTQQERMWLRKSAVNYSAKDNSLLLEDNIFNRVLLSLDTSAILCDSSDVNKDINSNAREYQTRDIAQILRNKCSLNRNKPGYGKTFESIEYCRLKDFSRILIICPKSVIMQWKDQFSIWWPEVADQVQILGDGPILKNRTIYITNYEQMLRQQVWQKCKMWTWNVIICDESHRIKSAGAKTTIAIKQLPSLHKLALTGTPILSHPDDLWSQLHFLNPQLSGSSYWAFVERFCEIEEDHFGRKPIGLTPSEGPKELLTRVLNLISVGGDNYKVTQGKNIIPVELEMTSEQQKLYRDVVHLVLEELEKAGVTVKNAMDQVIKQQQISTNCCKYGCKINPKFEWLHDWLEDNEGEKLVVFTKFAETAKALSEYLRNKKIPCALYIGALNSEAREGQKKIFIEGDTRVIVGTIGAMGTGVDGFQHVCRNVVFLDRDWTPGLNEQAEDRVNRSGQKGMTNIWILNMKKSIDKHVEDIQGKKASDIEEVFRNVGKNFSS